MTKIALVASTLPLPSPATARELLVFLLGPEHELHSVAHYSSSPRRLTVTCSCREAVTVDNEERFKRALRSMPLTEKVFAK
jgi:hypothetical protein